MTTATSPRETLLIDAMSRYVDGDAAGFDTVWRHLSGLVRARALGWVGDAGADDVVQQVFLKVHLNRHRYRPGSPVTPWVMTIARNQATDALRKRGRRKDRLTDEGTLPEWLPEGMAEPVPGETDEVVAAVREAVDQLPAAQRAVVRLHKLEEHSFDEVAATLGIQAGAARVRAHRAYGRLRDLLSPSLAAA